MFTVIIRRGELRDKQKLAFEFFPCRLYDVFIAYFSRYCRSSTRSSAHLKRVPSRTRNAGSCWKRNECRSRGNLEPMIMSTTRDDPPCWHVSRENVIGSESTRPIQSGAGTPWVNHDLTGLAEKRTGLVTLERRRAAEWTIPSASVSPSTTSVEPPYPRAFGRWHRHVFVISFFQSRIQPGLLCGIADCAGTVDDVIDGVRFWLVQEPVL